MARPKPPTPAPPCPNEAQHVVHPAGYIGHSNWADQMMLTHDTNQCPGCELWAIWTPMPGVDLAQPALIDGRCSRCGVYYGEGAPIRSDGQGGWLASCCPDQPQEPTP